VREEFLWRQIARLLPIEDRLGNIRREIAEADEAREVGWTDTLPLGECSKGDAFALDECRVEPARPEKQLYQSRIRFRGGKRIGAVRHYSYLPPGAAQPYRYGQKLGFSAPMPCDGVASPSSRAPSRSGRRRMSIWLTLTSIRSISEVRTARLRATGKLGPVLADLCSPREKPLLH